MKKKILWLIIVVLSFSILSAANSKSFKITTVDIEAQLNSDGSMQVEEARTYSFRGKYSFAYRTMPLDGPTRFSDFKIIENGETYVLADTKEPGTYQIYEDDGNTIIKWFYKARNEEKTFLFSYRVDGAIKRYEDVAVLYYQFISSEWRKKQRNINLRIIPPEEGHYGSIRHWLHGPLWGESKLEYNGEILAWADYVRSRQFFEIRALYPQELFPGLIKQNDYVEGSIIQEETKWVEESNRLREEYRVKMEKRAKREAVGRKFLPWLALLFLAYPIHLFNKFGKREKVNVPEGIISEKPDDLSPALVSYLMNSRSIYGSAFTATIFNLAVRKYITIVEEQIEKKSGKIKSVYNLHLNREFVEENRSQLKDYENDIIEFIFTELSEGLDNIAIKQLQKKQSKVTKFFNKWTKVVAEEAKTYEWYDRRSIKGGNITAIVAGIYLLLGIPLIFYFGVAGIYILGVSIISFIVALCIPHLTIEGCLQKKQWKAFKRFMTKKQYKNFDTEDLLNNLNDLFVFGVVFGLSNKFNRDLAGFIPESGHINYVYWYIIHGSGNHQSKTFNADSFSKSFSSMVTSTNGALSSSTGSGGGGSVGGGGGASSGGGGAG